MGVFFSSCWLYVRESTLWDTLTVSCSHSQQLRAKLTLTGAGQGLSCKSKSSQSCCKKKIKKRKRRKYYISGRGRVLRGCRYIFGASGASNSAPASASASEPLLWLRQGFRVGFRMRVTRCTERIY